MDDIDRYDKLAFLLFQLDCGIGLLNVIYECMNCGKYDTEMFTPAIYVTHEYFLSLRQTLLQFKEAAMVTQHGHEESNEDFVHQHKG